MIIIYIIYITILKQTSQYLCFQSFHTFIHRLLIYTYAKFVHNAQFGETCIYQKQVNTLNCGYVTPYVFCLFFRHIFIHQSRTVFSVITFYNTRSQPHQWVQEKCAILYYKECAHIKQKKLYEKSQGYKKNVFKKQNRLFPSGRRKQRARKTCKGIFGNKAPDTSGYPFANAV